jgi:hypothetical protein
MDSNNILVETETITFFPCSCSQKQRTPNNQIQVVLRKYDDCTQRTQFAYCNTLVFLPSISVSFN